MSENPQDPTQQPAPKKPTELTDWSLQTFQPQQAPAPQASQPSQVPQPQQAWGGQGQGYPPQPPPQQAYPPQQPYPPQQTYPPQQFPPQQGGYPPPTQARPPYPQQPPQQFPNYPPQAGPGFPPPPQGYGPPPPNYPGNYPQGQAFQGVKATGGAKTGLIAAAVVGAVVVVGAIAAMSSSSSSSRSASSSSSGGGLFSSSEGATSDSASSISGSAEFYDRFQTRKIRTCSAVTHKPGTTEMIALIECGQESEDVSSILLYSNMHVRMGGSRRYQELADSSATGIDTDAPVYPIDGSFDKYVCNPVSDISQNKGKNCSAWHHTSAEGKCFKTTMGEWKCAMNETDSAIQQTETTGPAEY